MLISEWIEKLGRIIFESPFNIADHPGIMPEMAEIRLAILDQVKARSHRVTGRDVFPYNQVRVLIRGVPEAQAGILRDSFFASFCEQEVRAGLARSGCRFPPELRVEVATVPELPSRGEEWLVVEVESRAPAVSPAPRRSGRLVVMKGSANSKEIPLSKARTNIGRSTDVYRSDGPSRRNDLAFAETGDINRTVSREHAHILYSRAEGEYRLFNDRYYKPGESPDGNCGLWIIRDGLSRAVHRNARGVHLQNGDEIHLGKAVVRFVAR